MNKLTLHDGLKTISRLDYTRYCSSSSPSLLRGGINHLNNNNNNSNQIGQPTTTTPWRSYFTSSRVHYKSSTFNIDHIHLNVADPSSPSPFNTINRILNKKMVAKNGEVVDDISSWLLSPLPIDPNTNVQISSQEMLSMRNSIHHNNNSIEDNNNTTSTTMSKRGRKPKKMLDEHQDALQNATLELLTQQQVQLNMIQQQLKQQKKNILENKSSNRADNEVILPNTEHLINNIDQFNAVTAKVTRGRGRPRKIATQPAEEEEEEYEEQNNKADQELDAPSQVKAKQDKQEEGEEQEGEQKQEGYKSLERYSHKSLFKVLNTELRQDSTQFLKLYLGEIKYGAQPVLNDIYEWVLEMEIKDTDVYNLFLEAHEFQKDLKEFDKVLETMQKNKIEQNVESVRIQMRHFINNKQMVRGEEVFSSLVKSKMVPTAEIIRLLVTGYGGVPTIIAKVQSYFQKYAHLKTPEIYNLFIANAISNNDTSEVKQLYRKMTDNGVLANMETYHLLVSMFGRLGKFETASNVALRVPKHLGSKELLHSSIIKSFVDHNMMGRALRYVSKLINYKQIEILRPLPLGILVHSLLSKNMDKEFTILLNRLEERGMLSLSPYNTVLRHVSQHRNKEEYLELYCKMIQTIRPSYHTFKSLIQVAMKSQDVQGCKILEQQILGELSDFKVGLFRDIIKFYHTMGDFEALDDTINYCFKAGNTVPNGINHILVHFEVENNQELLEYLKKKLGECQTSFISIHITKTIQLLLVIGNYPAALDWLALRHERFGLPIDEFAILPFYYFHKLRGEYDLCSYWMEKADHHGATLESVPQHFETYFRLNLRRDGTFVSWKEHSEGKEFEELYNAVNHPHAAHLENRVQQVFGDVMARRASEPEEEIVLQNIDVEGYYEPTRTYEKIIRENEPEQTIIPPIPRQIGLTSTSVSAKMNGRVVELSATNINNQTYVHIDFASRITYLINQNMLNTALTETWEREQSGQFVGEFVYISLLTYLIKEGREADAREVFVKMLRKQYKPPMATIFKLFKLTNESGTLSFIADIPPEIKPAYLDEKYYSFLVSANLDKGLKQITGKAKEELLAHQDYRNALAVGFLQQQSYSMAEFLISNIISSGNSLQLMVINEYIEQLKSFPERYNPQLLISMRKHLMTRSVVPPPELEILINKLNPREDGDHLNRVQQQQRL